MIQSKIKFNIKSIKKDRANLVFFVVFFCLIKLASANIENGVHLCFFKDSSARKVLTIQLHNIKELYSYEFNNPTRIVINSFFWGKGIEPHPIFYPFLDSLSLAITQLQISNVNVLIGYEDKKNKKLAYERANYIKEYFERLTFGNDKIKSECYFMVPNGLLNEEKFSLILELTP